MSRAPQDSGGYKSINLDRRRAGGPTGAEGEGVWGAEYPSPLEVGLAPPQKKIANYMQKMMFGAHFVTILPPLQELGGPRFI